MSHRFGFFISMYIRCSLLSLQVVPGVREEDDMDIRQYVKFKKIPGGSKSDCQLVSGVVFTKNITNKKMNCTLHNPKILVLSCAIDYQVRLVVVCLFICLCVCVFVLLCFCLSTCLYCTSCCSCVYSCATDYQVSPCCCYVFVYLCVYTVHCTLVVQLVTAF